MTKRQSKGFHWPTVTRDGTLFLVGLLLTVYEAIIKQGPPRVELLMVYCGMMGLPVFLHSDEKKKSDDVEKAP